MAEKPKNPLLDPANYSFKPSDYVGGDSRNGLNDKGKMSLLDQMTDKLDANKDGGIDKKEFAMFEKAANSSGLKLGKVLKQAGVFNNPEMREAMGGRLGVFGLNLVGSTVGYSALLPKSASVPKEDVRDFLRAVGKQVLDHIPEGEVIVGEITPLASPEPAKGAGATNQAPVKGAKR